MAAKGRITVTVNPTFKYGVYINGLICGLSIVVMLVISYFPPSDHVRSEELFWIFKHTFLLTAGAFIGLLGGRVAGPDHAG